MPNASTQSSVAFPLAFVACSQHHATISLDTGWLRSDFPEEVLKKVAKESGAITEDFVFHCLELLGRHTCRIVLCFEHVWHDRRNQCSTMDMDTGMTGHIASDFTTSHGESHESHIFQSQFLEKIQQIICQSIVV